MVKEISAMFVAGPPVVNRLSPKQYDKQELGGWEIQLRAGAIDEAVDSEDEAFAAARRQCRHELFEAMRMASHRLAALGMAASSLVVTANALRLGRTKGVTA